MVGFSGYFKKPVFLSTLICILIFYSGIISIPTKYPYISIISTEKIQKIEGKIINAPVKNSKGNYYSCTFELNAVQGVGSVVAAAKGRIKIYIPTESVEAFYPGKLYSSSKDDSKTIFETGGIYTFEGTFSNNNFYASKCIYSKWQDSVFSKIDFFRALCRLQFKRLMYSWGEAGGLLLALLCGAKEYTNSTIQDCFRGAGLSHILALSGMHLSMFSSIAIFFGKKVKVKKVSFVIRIISLFFFIWFAGLSPSLFRAYICAMLTLFSTMAGCKQPDMILILCFSFLLQSSISPEDIHNLGFILSYSALAGILIFNRLFNSLYSKIFPKLLSNSLSSSTSAQIFTVPVSLKMFGSFAPIGIIATTIVSPLITVFIYTGLLLIILCLISPMLSGYSATFMNFLYNIIKIAVVLFAKAPKWSLN